jgi:Tfp pilus assembly protein PilX
MTPRISRKDDSGAALVLALIVVTVVAIVTAVVLSFADTSLRTTVNLRDQAASAATADGAAQIAINALRTGNYNGVSNNCFDSGSTDTMLAAPTTFGTSAVKCKWDQNRSYATSNVAINTVNRPRNAILTLGQGKPDVEDGINVNVNGNGNGNELQVQGGIFSKSTINVVKGSLTTTGSVTARGDCTGTITSSPTRVCDIGAAPDTRGEDPAYAAPTPTAPVPVGRVPGTCTNNVAVFQPGLYSDVNALNALTSTKGPNTCKDGIFYFSPGIYYFNFTSTNKPDDSRWNIDTGTLIGGTLTAPDQPNASDPPDIPGACKSPIPPDSVPNGGWTPPAGVQFVFGGESHIMLDGTARAEICGTFSTTSPPIAIYGLNSAVATSTGLVPAESGCTIAPGGCALIQTALSPDSNFYVEGTTYTPSALLNIGLNNRSVQAFRFGVIARAIEVFVTGSATQSEPLFQVPDDAPGLRTVVDLDVYVCPGTSPCAADGAPRLRVVVGLIDPYGAWVRSTRQIVIYSWSEGG